MNAVHGQCQYCEQTTETTSLLGSGVHRLSLRLPDWYYPVHLQLMIIYTRQTMKIKNSRAKSRWEGRTNTTHDNNIWQLKEKVPLIATISWCQNKQPYKLQKVRYALLKPKHAKRPLMYGGRRSEDRRRDNWNPCWHSNLHKLKCQLLSWTELTVWIYWGWRHEQTNHKKTKTCHVA